VAIFVSIRTRQKTLEFQKHVHKSKIRLEHFRLIGRDRIIQILYTMEDILLDAKREANSQNQVNDIVDKLKEKSDSIMTGFANLESAGTALEKSKFNQRVDWTDGVIMHEDIIIGAFERAYESTSGAQIRKHLGQAIESFQTLSASFHKRIEAEIEAFSEDAD